MADDLDVFYSYLIRAKTAIDPLAYGHDVWPRVFLEAAVGPFMQGLRQNPRAAYEVMGEILPRVVTIVNLIQYAAAQRDYRRVFEESNVLYTAMQSLPGGPAILPPAPVKSKPTPSKQSPSNPPGKEPQPKRD
jgi:hypothetical protein